MGAGDKRQFGDRHLICPNCDTQNNAGAKFCQECGTLLAASCPNCGAQNNPGAKFCQECGTPLTATAPAAEAVAPSGSQSERKLVTVLFADLVGFTPFAEERDAEDVRDTLTRYFDLARDVIGRYGGTIEKFIGDAVMAVCGAPVVREDDAELAVRAALELVDAVTSLGPGIQARAGVLTGEAAVTVGATNQGMVAGDIVNTASRLQSAAPPGSVLVGESTQRAASAAIVFEPAGEQVLKGKQSPVPAWRAVRVVGERGGRNRSEQMEAPFVGRQEELRLLKDLFHATEREQRLRVVSVVGPAGIGKSRLSWEFSKYLDGLVEPIYWHRGRSPAYGQGITFWALGEMIRERCGLAESDDEPTTRAKVHEQAEQWITDADERAWIERALLALLGVETGVAADELFGAWRTFFERIAEQGTVVLLFEDMHFADTGLLDFVDHLLDWSRGLPIYLVTLARPDLIERRPSWGAGKRNFVSLYLEPLSDEDMRELLAGLAPGLPERAVAAIVARADGIPLYAVETVRTLVADGRLVLRDGAYAPVGDLTNLAVPDTLTALIAARLDSLDETDRRIVHDAAVLGQSFTAESLAVLVGAPLKELEPRLTGLVRRELLRREMDPRSPERGQYEFVQALIREVAYNTLSKKDRKKLHLAAARYFEALGSDEIAGALASHYLAAHANASEPAEAEALASQARIALKAAAARAEALGSFGQAVEYLDQALTVTQDPREQATVLIQAGSDLRVAARLEDAEQRFRSAIDIATASTDLSAKARATAELGLTLVRQYKGAEAQELLAPALDEFASVDEELQVSLKIAMARALWHQREAAGAYAIAEQVLDVAERHAYPKWIAAAFWIKANTLWHFGRRREAMAIGEAGRRLAEEAGLTDEAISMMSGLSNALSEFDQGAAAASYREVIAIARRTGRRDELLGAIASFGYMGFTGGLWDEAMAELEPTLAEDVPQRHWRVLINNWADIRAGRGENVDDVLVKMEQAEDGISDLARVYRLDVLSQVQMARGDFAAASKNYQVQTEIDASNSNETYYRAGICEVLAGNLDAARRLHGALMETGGYGPITEARRQSLSAGIAALEGRTEEAMVLYREALENWRLARAGWDEALTGVTVASVLDPSDPDVAAVINSTREILERLRAKPYLDRLDKAVARETAPDAARRKLSAKAEAAVSS